MVWLSMSAEMMQACLLGRCEGEKEAEKEAEENPAP
jgi:hypothetical protein